VPVNRILVVLVDRMQMPREGPDGQMISYKFHHRASGKQLLDEQTLRQAGVHQGDVLRLQPEITAGGLRLRWGDSFGPRLGWGDSCTVAPLAKEGVAVQLPPQRLAQRLAQRPALEP